MVIVESDDRSGQLSAQLVYLFYLFLRSEERLDSHLAQDVMDVGLRQVGQDGYGDGAKADDGQIGHAPVVGILAEDGDAIALLHPLRAQQVGKGQNAQMKFAVRKRLFHRHADCRQIFIFGTTGIDHVIDGHSDLNTRIHCTPLC
ncbi:MAG: hypothetical protein ACD_75C00327G0001 [uncultured bacterium]|nr:MAG: hypothetical protein ACD_75C00327G0001 [uncultured bacterium]